MATEADIHEAARATTTQKREGDDNILTSEPLEVFSNKCFKDEMKKIEPVAQPPGNVCDTEKPEETPDQNVNVVIQGNFGTIEGESFLESPSVTKVAFEETSRLSDSYQPAEVPQEKMQLVKENDEERQINILEGTNTVDISPSTTSKDAEDIDKREVAEEQNLSTVDLVETARDVEVEMPNKNAGDIDITHPLVVEAIQVGGEKHEENATPLCDEKHVSQAYEATKDLESTILEHTSTEGACIEIDDAMKLCESNSEEKLRAGDNKGEEIKQKEDDSVDESHGITMKGEDKESCTVKEDAPENKTCIGEAADDNSETAATEPSEEDQGSRIDNAIVNISTPSTKIEVCEETKIADTDDGTEKHMTKDHTFTDISPESTGEDINNCSQEDKKGAEASKKMEERFATTSAGESIEKQVIMEEYKIEDQTVMFTEKEAFAGSANKDDMVECMAKQEASKGHETIGESKNTEKQTVEENIVLDIHSLAVEGEKVANTSGNEEIEKDIQPKAESREETSLNKAKAKDIMLMEASDLTFDGENSATAQTSEARPDNASVIAKPAETPELGDNEDHDNPISGEHGADEADKKIEEEVQDESCNKFPIDEDQKEVVIAETPSDNKLEEDNKAIPTLSLEDHNLMTIEAIEGTSEGTSEEKLVQIEKSKSKDDAGMGSTHIGKENEDKESQGEDQFTELKNEEGTFELEVNLNRDIDIIEIPKDKEPMDPGVADDKSENGKSVDEASEIAVACFTCADTEKPIQKQEDVIRSIEGSSSKDVDTENVIDELNTAGHIHETTPDVEYQGVEVPVDREIILDKTTEITEELQVSSTPLPPNEDDHDATIAIEKIEEEIRKKGETEDDAMKLEDNSSLVSQFSTIQPENAEDVSVIEEKEANEIEVEETNTSQEVFVSEDRQAEHIHEKGTSLTLEKTDICEMEKEINDIRETTPGAEYQSVEAVSDREIILDETIETTEEKLQVPSTALPSKEDDHDIPITIAKIEEESTKKEETEVDTMKLEENSSSVSSTIQPEIAEHVSVIEEKEVEIEETNTSHAVFVSEDREAEHMDEKGPSLTLEKTDTCKIEREINDVHETAPDVEYQGVEAVVDREIILDQTTEITEEELQVSYTPMPPNEDEHNATVIMDKIEEESTKKEETEADTMKLEENTSLVSQFSTIQQENAKDVTVIEEKEANEIEVEETNTFHEEFVSEDTEAERIHEKATSLTSEKIGTCEMEREINDLHETTPDVEYQGVEAIVDREIILDQTTEITEEELQVSSTPLPSKEDDHDATVTIDKIEEEETKKEETEPDTTKLEENSSSVSQFSPIQPENVEHVSVIEEKEANEVEIFVSEDIEAEHIHKKEPSLTSEKTDTCKIEREINDVHETTPDVESQGVESVVHREIIIDQTTGITEELQVSSTPLPSNEDAHDATVTIEKIDEEITKKEDTETDTMNLEENSSLVSQFSTIQPENAKDVSVIEEKEANEIEVEESHTSHEVFVSEDGESEHTHEKATSLALEKTDTCEMEKEVNDVRETNPGTEYQDVEAVSDREIILGETIEITQEKLQVPSTALPSKEDDRDATITIEKSGEETDVDTMKLEENSSSMFSTIQPEIAENVSMIEEKKANKVEFEETKTSHAVFVSEDSEAEHIHEKGLSLTLETDTCKSESEINDVHETAPGVEYQGVEAFVDRESILDQTTEITEEELQVSSTPLPSNENDHDTTVTIERIEEEITKKEETEADTMKLEENSRLVSQFTTIQPENAEDVSVVEEKPANEIEVEETNTSHEVYVSEDREAEVIREKGPSLTLEKTDICKIEKEINDVQETTPDIEYQGVEAVGDREIILEQTTEMTSEKLQVPSTALPSKEGDHDSTITSDKIEEEITRKEEREVDTAKLEENSSLVSQFSKFQPENAEDVCVIEANEIEVEETKTCHEVFVSEDREAEHIHEKGASLTSEKTDICEMEKEINDVGETTPRSEYQGVEAVSDREIILDETIEITEEKLQVPSTALPSKEDDRDATITIEKIEEESTKKEETDVDTMKLEENLSSVCSAIQPEIAEHVRVIEEKHANEVEVEETNTSHAVLVSEDREGEHIHEKGLSLALEKTDTCKSEREINDVHETAPDVEYQGFEAVVDREIILDQTTEITEEELQVSSTPLPSNEDDHEATVAIERIEEESTRKEEIESDTMKLEENSSLVSQFTTIQPENVEDVSVVEEKMANEIKVGETNTSHEVFVSEHSHEKETSLTSEKTDSCELKKEINDVRETTPGAEYQDVEAVFDREIILGETIEITEEKLQDPSTALPTKESDHDATITSERIEEERTSVEEREADTAKLQVSQFSTIQPENAEDVSVVEEKEANEVEVEETNTSHEVFVLEHIEAEHIHEKGPSVTLEKTDTCKTEKEINDVHETTPDVEYQGVEAVVDHEIIFDKTTEITEEELQVSSTPMPLNEDEHNATITVEKIEEESTKKEETEADTMKLEENASLVSQFTTIQPDSARDVSVMEEKEANKIEVEETNTSHEGFVSEDTEAERIHEKATSSTSEKTGTCEMVKEINDVRETTPGAEYQGVEANSGREHILDETMEITEEKLQVPSTASPSKEEDRDATITIQKIEESTKKEETEDDFMKLEETSSSVFSTIQLENAECVSVIEKKQVNKVEVEETNSSHAVFVSEDREAEDIDEKGPSLTSEKTDTCKIEREINDVFETTTEVEYQGVEEVIDREIILDQTTELKEEGFQVSSTPLPSTEDVHDATVTIERIEEESPKKEKTEADTMKLEENSSLVSQFTTIQPDNAEDVSVVEEEKANEIEVEDSNTSHEEETEADTMKLEENSTMVSQFSTIQLENAEDVRVIEEKEANEVEVEVEETSTSHVVLVSADREVENIHEDDTSLTLKKTDACKMENEIKDVHEISDPEYQGVEAIDDGEITLNQTNEITEEKLQVPSTTLLSKEDKNEETIITEKIEDLIKKSDEAEVDSMKDQEASDMVSQLTTTEPENVGDMKILEKEADKVEETKTSDAVSITEGRDGKEIHETRTNLTLEETNACKREEEIKDVPEIIPDPIYQAAKTVTDDEFTSDRTTEKLQEQLQVQSTALLSKEEEDIMTTTTREIEDETTTREETEVDTMKLAKNSFTVSQMSTIEPENAEGKERDEDEVEGEEIKILNAAFISKDRDNEEIQEHRRSSNVVKTDASDTEEINEVPNTELEPKYNGLETVADDESNQDQSLTAAKSEEQLHNPSPPFLPEEEDHKVSNPINRLEDESTMKEEIEVDTMKLDENSCLLSQLSAVELEIVKDTNVNAEKVALEVEERKTPDTVLLSDDRDVDVIREIRTFITVEKTNANKEEEDIERFPKTISAAEYSGVETVTDDEIIPKSDCQPEEQLKSLSTALASKKEDHEIASTIEKPQDETTKEDNTEVGIVKLQEATEFSQLSTSETENQNEMIVNVEKETVEVEAESNKTSDTAHKSRDQGVKETLETDASPTIEKIDIKEVGKEISEVVSEPEYQDVEAGNDVRITPDQKLSAVELGDELQVPSSPLLIKDQDSASTSTLEDKSVEGNKTVHDSIKLEETADVNELADIIENVNADELEAAKSSNVVDEIKDQGVEGIHEVESIQTVGRTDTDNTLETYGAPEVISEPKYEGFEAVGDGMIASDPNLPAKISEDQFQQPSSAMLLKEEFQETVTITESTKIDDTQIHEKIADQLATSTTEERCVYNEEPRELEITNLKLNLLEETQDILTETPKEEQTDNKEVSPLEHQDCYSETKYVDSALECEKGAILSSSEGTSEDVDILHLSNLNKKADYLPNPQSTIKEILTEDVGELCKEAYSPEFEKPKKDTEYASEVHNPEALTIHKETVSDEKQLEGATPKLKDTEKQTEETSESNETTEDQVPSEKVKDEDNAFKDTHLVFLDEERIAKGDTEDELRQKEIPGENIYEVIDIKTYEIPSEEMSKELENASINKNVKEVAVVDRASDDNYQVLEANLIADECLSPEPGKEKSVEKAVEETPAFHEEVNSTGNVLVQNDELNRKNLEVPPVTDATAKDAAGKEIGENLVEVSDPAANEPIHKVINTHEENMDSATTETSISESLKENVKPEHIPLEKAYKGSDVTEGLLNLKDQELSENEPSTSSPAETSQKDKQDEENVKTSNNYNLVHGMQKTKEVSMLVEDELKENEEQIQCSTRETEKELDEAVIHSSMAVNEVMDAESEETTEKGPSQVAAHLTEERDLTVDTKELQTEKEVKALVEEGKTDEEEGDENKKEDTGSDALVIVEASRDIDVKVAHKKSHNILSGVGSKVKHSIAKVKKAITGKSGHPKQPLPK